MRVRVLFFGMLKEMAGRAADEIDLRDGASVRAVLAHYEAKVADLKRSLPFVAIAVNQQYAGPDTKLNANDEVALLPPVSGGSADDSRDPAATRYARIVREAIEAQAIAQKVRRGEDGAVLAF